MSDTRAESDIIFEQMNEQERARAWEIFNAVSSGTMSSEEAAPEVRRNEERVRQQMSQQQALAAEQKKQSQESARDLLSARLEAYGLKSLGDFVWNLITKENITSEYALVERIRATPEYQQRFAAMEMRRKNGMNAISEEEYISLENAYRQTMKMAGMPPGLFDTSDDFTKLIAGDVSSKELAARIEGGYQAVAQSNPQVIAEMKRLYNVKDSELAAYFIDPERTMPMILRSAQAAQIAAQGTLQANMQISQAEAEQLAIAGISQAEAQQGFQVIAQSQELFNPLAGTAEEAITQGEQIAGVFATGAAAQQRIRQRQRERTAVFEAGGRFAGQDTTVTGLQ